ncbi:MAG: hypothetical protein JOY83_16415 [Alphaproteobacteria bacterium]|nr:hypothetical protein [Alphaproteobacteria bacterium]
MDPYNLGSTSKVLNIFDWSSTDHVASIGGFAIPKGVSLGTPNITEYVSETRVVSSSYELQMSAKTDVEVNAGVPGVFEFSASRSVSDMQSSTQTRKWTYGYARAYRERHIARLDLLAAKPEYTILKAFRDAVGNLPPDDSDSARAKYARFIEEFGTHLTTSITLGGLAIQQTRGSASRYLTSRDSEEAFKLKASAVIKQVSAGASVDTATKTQASSDQSDELERTEVKFVGGTGSVVKGITDDWLESLEKNPAIVKASLDRISAVLDARFFAEDGAIEDKALLLDMAINRWIQSRGTPGCITAPLRYGEQLVLVLPWNDGKTLQYPVFSGSALTYPLTANNQPRYGGEQSAAIVLEHVDRTRADTPILSGDRFRIKHAASNRYAGPARFGTTFGSASAGDASIFIVVHENDNIENVGQQYFTEDDKMQIVFPQYTPGNPIDHFLGLNPSYDRRAEGMSQATQIVKFRMARAAWLA